MSRPQINSIQIYSANVYNINYKSWAIIDNARSPKETPISLACCRQQIRCSVWHTEKVRDRTGQDRMGQENDLRGHNKTRKDEAWQNRTLYNKAMNKNRFVSETFGQKAKCCAIFLFTRRYSNQRLAQIIHTHTRICYSHRDDGRSRLICPN